MLSMNLLHGALFLRHDTTWQASADTVTQTMLVLHVLGAEFLHLFVGKLCLIAGTSDCVISMLGECLP
jgi:hypothetical protein